MMFDDDHNNDSAYDAGNGIDNDDINDSANDNNMIL